MQYQGRSPIVTDRQFELFHSLVLTNLAKKESAVSENEIKETIKTYALIASHLLLESSVKISQEEKEELFHKIQTEIFVEWGDPSLLIDKSTRLKPWFESTIPEDKRYYWNRYSRYLETQKNWLPSVVSSLDEISSKIVNQLGNPNDDNSSWNRHGLVIGEVQSGKTANYTAIINKAADAGYDVIITLAGLSDSLRFQTQTRLDKEFAGRETGKEVGNTAIFKPIGVGLCCDQSNLRTPANCTSAVYDFNSVALDGKQFSISGLKEPCFFVLKKNVRVLENVYKWLANNNHLIGTAKINKSILLIDDEADNAGQNTKSEDTPSRINGCIRKILSLFNKSSYLAITATPFANIFVDPDSFNEEFESGLFPRDYLFLLSKPSDYIGVSELFSESSKRKNSIVQIDSSSLEGDPNNGIKGILPLKHKMDDPLDSLPEDLYEAMRYFVISNAILDKEYIHNPTLHRSMLINISRFVRKHSEILFFVNQWLNQAKSDFSNYAMNAQTCSKNPVYGELYKTYLVFKKFFPNKDDNYWFNLCEHQIISSTLKIQAVTVNRNKDSQEALDFDLATKKGESTRCIFIGGFALGRGLTLEGLIVSYIYRHTNCYDTLLQMGRWFGYRPGYDKLIKIWMDEDMIASYRDIADIVLPDLYSQIEDMNKTELSPIDFGLMIRSDISSLEITARNKMKTATKYRHPCRIDGHLVETPRLCNDLTILSENNRVVSSFIIQNLSSAKIVTGERSKYSTSGLLWEGISEEDVSSLVRNFKVHPWQLSFQSDSLADYILKKRINNWDVYIAGLKNEDTVSVANKKTIGQVTFVPFERPFILNKSTSSNIIRVSGSKVKVGQGGIARAGLTQKEYEAVKAKHPNKDLSDSWLLDVDNRKPLLIIYPIKPDPQKSDQVDLGNLDYVFALGLGFPGKAGKKVGSDYMVNIIKSRELELENEDD